MSTFIKLVIASLAEPNPIVIIIGPRSPLYHQGPRRVIWASRRVRNSGGQQKGLSLLHLHDFAFSVGRHVMKIKVSSHLIENLVPTTHMKFFPRTWTPHEQRDVIRALPDHSDRPGTPIFSIRPEILFHVKSMKKRNKHIDLLVYRFFAVSFRTVRRFFHLFSQSAESSFTGLHQALRFSMHRAN